MSVIHFRGLMSEETAPAQRVLMLLVVGELKPEEFPEKLLALCKSQNKDVVENFFSFGINVVEGRREYQEGRYSLPSGINQKDVRRLYELMGRVLSFIKREAYRNKYLAYSLRAVYLEQELNPSSNTIPAGNITDEKTNIHIIRAKAWAKKYADDTMRLAFDNPDNKELAQWLYN